MSALNRSLVPGIPHPILWPLVNIANLGFEKVTPSCMLLWSQVKLILTTGFIQDQLHTCALMDPNLEFVVDQTLLSMTTARFSLTSLQVLLSTDTGSTSPLCPSDQIGDIHLSTPVIVAYHP